MRTGLCSQLQQGINGDIIEHELCQPELVLEWQWSDLTIMISLNISYLKCSLTCNSGLYEVHIVKLFQNRFLTQTLWLKEMFEWHTYCICCCFARLVEILSERNIYCGMFSVLYICVHVYRHKHTKGEKNLLCCLKLSDMKLSQEKKITCIRQIQLQFLNPKPCHPYNNDNNKIL